MIGRKALALRRCRGGYEARERREERARKRRVAEAHREWSRMTVALWQARCAASAPDEPWSLDDDPAGFIAAITVLLFLAGGIVLMWWVW